MGVEVTWRRIGLTSRLHAAEAVARNEVLADARLAEALSAPAQELAATIQATGLPPERFWRHLIPLSANLPGRRLLLETAIMKTIGRGPSLDGIVAALEGPLAAVDMAGVAAVAQIDSDVGVRQRTLARPV